MICVLVTDDNNSDEYANEIVMIMRIAFHDDDSRNNDECDD